MNFSNTGTGGPAFPVSQAEAFAYASAIEDLANPALDAAERAHIQAKACALSGMTLRDYFAARAIVTMGEAVAGTDISGLDNAIKAMAVLSYKLADAMLAARNGGAA